VPRVEGVFGKDHYDVRTAGKPLPEPADGARQFLGVEGRWGSPAVLDLVCGQPRHLSVAEGQVTLPSWTVPTCRQLWSAS
jgi:hypothetical protein